MNKKFLSAILFGALTAASTSTFVSCKDYDDDIDQLQMQIDQNASSAASDLAAKVTALESQISTLNAAKQDLTSQLAAAKTEAANAAAAALEAAKGAQSGADAANKALAEAAAKVAVLETKVASLEGIVADLQTAKADLNAKVSDLQTQMAAVKADTKSNADAIAAANAEILAKYSELSGKISEVSTALGARIDVVDATLNTIKANYATKDELNTKAAELAAMDAQLNAQIATNLKYIETLQATVKDLAAKDAELAGKIEANYAELLGKINTMATEQAAALKDIQALQATVATLNSSYSTLSSAKADVTYVNEVKEGLTKLVEQLSTSTNTYSQYIEDLRDRVSKLEQGAADLQKKIDAAATQEALNAAIEDLKSQIREAGVASDATLAEAIEAVEASVAANAEEIASIKETLAGKADQSALDELAASLGLTQSDVMSITEGLVSLRGEIAEQKATLEGQIAAAETAAKEYAQAAVDGLNLRLVDAEELLAQLVAIGGEDLSAFITEDELADELADYITNEEFAAEFAAQKEAVNAEIKAMTEAYNTFKSETEAMVKAEVEKLTGVNEALVTLKDAVEALQEQVTLLVNRIQSIAFVPQYMDFNENVCVPTYFFNPEKEAVAITPTFEMKFRVQPADAASKLVALFATYPELIKLENSEKLQTRAENTEKFSVLNVYTDASDLSGYIRVVAQSKDLVNADNDVLYPTTLVIDGDMTTDENGESMDVNKVNTYKTSEFFNVRPTDFRSGMKTLAEASGKPAGMNLYQPNTTLLVSRGSARVSIWYNDFTLYAPSTTLKNSVKVNGQVGWNDEEIKHNLVLYAVEDKNGNIQTDFNHKDVKDASWYRFFNVSANGVQMKKENNAAINDAIEPTPAEVTVYIADAVYGKNNSGNWNVTYAVTYVADAHKLSSGMLDKTDKNAFAVSWQGISNNSDAVVKTFTFTKDEFTSSADDLKEYGYDNAKLFNELCDMINNGTQPTWSNANNKYYQVEFSADSKKGEIYATVTRLATAIYSFGDPIKNTATFENTYFKIGFDFAGTFSSVDDFYYKAAERWTDWTPNAEAKKLSVNFNWDDVKNANGTYHYSIDMNGAYTNMSKYTGANYGCTYNFELLPHVHKNATSALNASTIEFNGGNLNVYAPVKDMSGCNIAFDDVQFKLTVKDYNGEVMKGKNGEDATVNNISFVYPLANKHFAIKDISKNETTNLGKLNAGEVINVAKFVNLTSDVNGMNVPFIVKGELQDSDNRVKNWNISSVEYKALSITSAAGDVLPGNIELSQDGELTVKDPGNITLDVTVKISVEVTYQFGKVSTEYEVTIPKQI